MSLVFVVEPRISRRHIEKRTMLVDGRKVEVKVVRGNTQHIAGVRQRYQDHARDLFCYYRMEALRDREEFRKRIAA